MTDPLTLEQAASQLGMSPDALRVQVNRGVLKARRLGPIWIVDQTEVERYRAEHRRVPNGHQARIDAEEKAGYWLSLGNQAAERGEHEKAERHYAKAQRWQDRMNRILGNGDGE